MTNDTAILPSKPERLKFTDWLEVQRGGHLSVELTDALASLITAVRETGKGGDLVLKVSIKPATPGDDHQFFVTDDLRVKPPAPTKSPNLFFYDQDRVGLCRNDPRQGSLNLRSVTPVEVESLRAI